MSNPTVTPLGGSTVTFVGSRQETVQYPGQETVDVTRYNVDGVARKKIGVRGRKVQVFFSVNIDRDDYQDKVKELRSHQGQFCTFVNSLGVSETLHCDLVEVSYQPAEKWVGGVTLAGATQVLTLQARYLFTETRTQ